MIPVVANLVWPAMYLALGMVSIWPILGGLVVELFFVRYATTLQGSLCFAATVAMNLASALLGALLIPLSGIAWELIATLTINPLLGGTFNPVTWGVTYLVAALINACIESLVLRHLFARNLGRGKFWLLVLANLVTVGIAVATMSFE